MALSTTCAHQSTSAQGAAGQRVADWTTQRWSRRARQHRAAACASANAAAADNSVFTAADGELAAARSLQRMSATSKDMGHIAGGDARGPRRGAGQPNDSGRSLTGKRRGTGRSEQQKSGEVGEAATQAPAGLAVRRRARDAAIARRRRTLKEGRTGHTNDLKRQRRT
ncbi:hypothetical protein ERJ75_000780600 [Trypanosoma vivax]|nr:hypothetical protein ERJ75_000780600 [Trypanosoma vivax]